jgi:ABC-2 type transport system ATP-binding protein
MIMGAGVENSQARITADRVGKWFGEVIAVNNCSLSVGAGVVGLLGSNGAGKSTLFKMLAGLTEPNQGEVRVFGRRLRDEVGWYRKVGFCPENEVLPEWMTGREFLSLQLRLMGYDKTEVERRVKYWLDRFELTDAAGRRLGGYSKGMRQKMKLAQALAHDPEVIFLDEPLNGMDPVSRKQSIDLVRELGEAGRTVLVSSHILPEVESMTSQIILIDRGRVLAEGSVTEIRDKIPEHPTTVALVSENPRHLAGFLIGQDHVVSVGLDPDERVIVKTDHALNFYRTLPVWLLENGLAVEEILTLDDSLEAVFDYLTQP